MQWLSWDEVAALEPGTALLVDGGEHRPRLRARVLRADSDGRGLWAITRGTRGTRGPVLLGPATVKRARVIPALFEDGDPVLRVGVPADKWRGGVVSTDRAGLVRVETLDGFEEVDEAELEAPEDREVVRPALKPGPPASDPVVEASNQAAYQARRR